MNKNIKAIDFDMWNGIDGFLAATSGGAVTRASALKSIVPWLAKAVSMTSNAVAGMPFEIVNSSGDVIDTSSDWSNVIGGMDSPRRLLMLLSSSLCGGSAYMIPVRTSRRLVNLQYVSPHTITPHIDVNGLQYFDRVTDKGRVQRIMPDELIYFWLPDSEVEIGCPLTSPMSSSLIASELLASMSITMKTYGDRGFVPAYIGNVKGMPSQDEKKKAENYLTRFLRGAYSSVVKLINSESLELVRVGAGMEELKGAYTEIQQQAIEDIGTAFGIPAALFMSDKSFASEVNSLTRTWYETSTFITIYHTLEEVFNEQVFKPYGVRMQFKPETLSVFQDDENERANAVSTYTAAIVSNPQVAKFVMSFMGVDLDEEQEHELDEIVAGMDEATEEVTEAAQPEGTDMESEAELAPEMEQPEPLSPDETKDLALWYSKAKAWSIKGKGTAVDWENKHLREEIAAPIRLRLADAKNELDIVKAFEIGKQPSKPVHDDSAIKALAASINAAVEASTKETTTPAPVYNMTMPAINLTAQMPAMPMEATITTDKATGQKTLKVKK